MIDQQTYTVEWIADLRNKIGYRTDPKLIEKVVRALGLLEQLKHFNLDFIFKGGTSILLVTEKPTRFSIDIDIITEQTREEIELILNLIVQYGTFSHWKPDYNRKHPLDALIDHFKLYYTSVIDGKVEPILLDVLYSPSPYTAVREIAIEHSWLNQNGSPLTVQVPTLEAILGDKLTAFAPETTGILYSKNRPVEIIKQLYDISQLIDKVEDINIVRGSFRSVVQAEISFRKLDIHWRQVLEDIENTAYVLATRDIGSIQFRHLQTGIRNITNFIIGRFGIEEAIVAGAKAAYFAALIRTETSVEPVRYSMSDEMADWEINTVSRSKIRKLKKANPQAFFYWYQALQLTND